MLARIDSFDEHKLAAATAELRELARLHASQPGYTGSVTVQLGEGRQLTRPPLGQRAARICGAREPP
jgi:hypothetical protein